MRREKLTKKFVDDLAAPAGKRIVVFEPALPGFCIRVLPSGKKFYGLKYVNRHGRQRWLSLGMHGVLTPTQARQRAQQLLGKIKAGEDPAEDQQKDRSALTAKTFSDRFLNEHVDVHNKPATRRHVRSDLKNHILPAFGRRPVASITTRDVTKLHLSLQKTPVAANRVVRVLSKMFNHAEIWGLRSSHTNPCRGVTKYREKRRERYLSPTELVALGQAISESVEAKEIDSTAADAIRLIALTGCRPSEITCLRWEEVNLPRALLVLDDSKTGEKLVRLGAHARELLAHRRQKCTYVFPSPKKQNSPYRELKRPWHHVLEKSGVQDLFLKDFRHTQASVAGESGYSLLQIGQLLGHTQPSTTAIYTHWTDDHIGQIAERVQGRIGAALSGSPDATVLPLRSSKT
ncbi:MAG: tyrosine-type recombinase/integrase [Deltaproteobacteria bacterium]|nr:tyrosine-type recombinase/integrase [Deltaproteobacteria bacterium]MBW2446752.1 tyrosine-type recombinase/integrase [Deltaproteobacteria bacterium]